MLCLSWSPRGIISFELDYKGESNHNIEKARFGVVEWTITSA